MKIFQLIYTSCKRGLSSGAGFQTYSMSEGITGEERRELERYGLYVPPTNLPSQPTKEEIDTLFPVALRFFRLESGRFGVCQSKYIGQDYSGRYGNYFCHAFVLENGNFPVYPIQLLHAPAFRDCLAEAEQAEESTPPPLPALDLEEVISYPSVRIEDIMEFVGNNGIEPVKEMVAAVINHTNTHRNLVLSDNKSNIPYWIAALQMAFTVKLAHHLTFSTYSHDPTGMNFMIFGVPGKGSRFAFSETQRNYEYYIFDLENSKTGVVEDEYEFNQSVDLGYTVSSESLQELQDFIDLFDFDFINPEIDSVGDLLNIARVGVGDLPTERILAAVQFANRFASQEVLGQLSDSLEQILDTVTSTVDDRAAEIVTKFLFKISRQTGSQRHLDTAYNFFFQALHHLIIEDPQVTLESVENYYNSIRDENKTRDKEFAQRVLSLKQLEQITQSLANNRAPLPAEIYFHLIVGTIISFQYNWHSIMENNPKFGAFIQTSMKSMAASERNLNGAVSTAGRNKDFFVEFVSFCLTQKIVPEKKPGVFLNSFIKTLENKPTDMAVDVRLKLIQYGHHDFIYNEYAELLKRAPKKPVFFWTYFDNIFNEDSDFAQQKFGAAVEQYLHFLPAEEQPPQCEKLIGYEEWITSKQVLKKVVEGFEDGMPLSEPGTTRWEKARLVSKLKENHQLTTSPDISRLSLFGVELMQEALKPGGDNVLENLKKDTHSLEHLDVERAKQYFTWCLPNLLRLVRSKKDHETIFQWFWNSKLNKAYVQDYVVQLKKIIKEEKKEGPEILLRFLEFYLSTILENKRYHTTRKKIHDELVRIFSNMSTSQYKYIRYQINASRFVTEGKSRRELLNIFSEVPAKDKSIINRIKGKIFR